MPSGQIINYYGYETKLTLPDGMGGWADLAFDKMAAAYCPPHFMTDYRTQTALLGWLNPIWGNVVAKGQGVNDTLVTGAGNASIGLV